MTEKQFTHLHLHTEYSLLDGAIKLDQLIKRVKDCGMKSVAMTDHGNIFGAVKFFDLCKKNDIKPILGIESYITENTAIKDAENKYYHQLLIVQNDEGYKNLCKLISFSFNEGFYFKPRIDYNALKKYSNGLIASSACLGGHIPSLIIKNQLDEAKKRIEWFIDVFGPNRFFLEVQPEDQEEQVLVNNKLYELANEYNVNVIGTTDAHYLTADYRDAHETMLCIQTHHKIDDEDRMSFGSCKPWVRSTQEMLEAFPNHEEVLWNTQKVVEQCNFKFETGKLFFPVFEIPDGYSQESFFDELCEKGFNKLIEQGHISAEDAHYPDRLTLERDLIKKMGFVGYFLIVSDFIQWAKRNHIPVGPGRGSAAGSLVAWTLEITNIDPLKYNLLFERFLNPERISMPDIDIDFCVEGRERVIQYCREKYGHEKVCNIITFGTMAAKGVLKDVARALGLPFEDANAITNLVPDQLKISLEEALEQEPRLKELKNSNPKVAHLFDLAFRLEGLTRHASKHAAGIVISPKPIDEVLPVYIPPKSTELVTQYAMTELEKLGFLKIDFLGLKNLTLIDRIIKLIKRVRNIDIDIDKIPTDDAKTFELICQGKTSGVFQLESDGLKDVLRRLQPEKFEDIIAVNALYRPGPLGSGMVDDFIERKHGRQKISYLFDDLEPILKETYGVIVYQEQVMKIASAIGGYSLGEADILRRAMGKKKVDVMAQQREIFLSRAKERHYDEKKSGELFDLMAYFAGYGFNKSHSAAYAKIAYQTAFLKANYLPEFMACLISLEMDNAEKMSFYLEEAKDLTLKILPPDINTSEITFTVIDGKLLFGLQGIKNVGLAALENIIEERKKKPFFDMLDFCSRIDLRTANKRVIENLIYAGAFDTLPGNRSQQFEELSSILERAINRKRELETGQMGLFSTIKKEAGTPEPYVFQLLPEWSDKEKLHHEKEVIGFYLSAHPLDAYQPIIKRVKVNEFAQSSHIIQQTKGNQEPTFVGCGLMRSHRMIFTKKGDRMAFVQLEDASGTAEIILFPKTFAKVEQWIEEHNVFFVKGPLDLTSPEKCKIKANLFIPAELFFEQWPDISAITIQLPANMNYDSFKTLNNYLEKGDKKLSFIYQENGKELHLTTKHTVTLTENLIKNVEALGAKIKLTT
ncbi:TPA: DNA polymerase III subunit alpha [Candidatus Dependentiae bacterium]|nr:MAG: polymerase III, alpha subunit protein [candidate division TM6 bacterium GW2011_GWF2_36_131]KKQ02657.1 MAG: polymerase III, alpha subunit protein [candidate division TM6 bacterium GW2011_GWE2_36_25]KKQ18101.1 MAG: polymerase III, alpha subunit protein [candidate division TM6 bacterium GW2011_GWA2_36_9]HBR70289.1 DNA polymerase III subunit alpha [Candidatus Dependentiae bacterium]HCU00939.1 DNA polymerase III subunit alpha [Candidatus Dependentiae bacterium]